MGTGISAKVLESSLRRRVGHVISMLASALLKGNVAVYMVLNLDIVTKNSFCHELNVERSRTQRARSLVNCMY